MNPALMEPMVRAEIADRRRVAATRRPAAGGQPGRVPAEIWKPVVTTAAVGPTRRTIGWFFVRVGLRLAQPRAHAGIEEMTADRRPTAKKVTAAPEEGALDEPASTKGPSGRRLITDPRTMRALAHPVRIALLEILGREGELTVTRAAEMLDESPGNMSWHLQTLAKYGYIEEAGGGKGRSRPWRIASVSNRFQTATEDPDIEAAGEALESTFVGVGLLAASGVVVPAILLPVRLARSSLHHGFTWLPDIRGDGRARGGNRRALQPVSRSSP